MIPQKLRVLDKKIQFRHADQRHRIRRDVTVRSHMVLSLLAAGSLSLYFIYVTTFYFNIEMLACNRSQWCSSKSQSTSWKLRILGTKLHDSTQASNSDLETRYDYLIQTDMIYRNLQQRNLNISPPIHKENPEAQKGRSSYCFRSSLSLAMALSTCYISEPLCFCIS